MATSTGTRRKLAALVVIAALAVTLPAAAAAAGTRSTIRIEALTNAQIEDVGWALSRFEAAGIALPSITIVFHDNYEACGMRQGVLSISLNEATIDECMQDRPGIRRSLLHELAHAWDRLGDGFDVEARRQFLNLRKLTSWDDPGQEWNRRGEEQAAEIIAWGLMEAPAPIPTSVGNLGPQDTGNLSRAFQVLVGSPPPFLSSNP